MTFTGRLGDPEVADLMRSARALVVTAAEEFGIAAVESLASGRPVIALGAGGVLESVRAGETGVYYDAGDPEALADAVAGFDPLAVDPAACVAASRRFAVPRFQHALRALVAESGRRAGARRRPPRGGWMTALPYCAVRHTRGAKSPRFRFNSSSVPKTRVQRAQNRVTCGGAEGCL